jgi:hypothetical protein
VLPVKYELCFISQKTAFFKEIFSLNPKKEYYNESALGSHILNNLSLSVATQIVPGT